ncbi:hypothetical protein JOB18_042296 [Solea senegalensis]|uniref:Uncharacterized protein n=1 Tax=Solea senegalensis TaxID=28829 RepID=A0AAV6QEG8_SOLSE|nr:hypothetical protein JOB18_042296 [Solea senegalensis]
MESGVFLSSLGQFMLSPLVTWVRTFVPNDEGMHLDFAELLDGVFLNDIMTQMQLANFTDVCRFEGRQASGDNISQCKHVSLVPSQLQLPSRHDWFRLLVQLHWHPCTTLTPAGRSDTLRFTVTRGNQLTRQQEQFSFTLSHLVSTDGRVMDNVMQPYRGADTDRLALARWVETGGEDAARGNIVK